jgi:hypothetical protein
MDGGGNVLEGSAARMEIDHDSFLYAEVAEVLALLDSHQGVQHLIGAKLVQREKLRGEPGIHAEQAPLLLSILVEEIP